MKKLCLILCLLFTASLKADLQWQTITPLDAPVRFQMPGIPEEKTRDKLSSWKVVTEDNTYWAVLDVETNDKVNFVPEIFQRLRKLFNFVVTEKVVIVHSKWEKKWWHFIIKNPETSFYHTSTYYHKSFTLALITKSASEDPEAHQRFIGSFAFLE